MDGIRDLMQSQTVRQFREDRQRCTYLFPALDLCVSIDAWDMCITSCIVRDEGAFCDEQGPWCGTALRVVGCLLRARDMRGMRSEPGQGGKDDTVLKRQSANLDRLEERGCLLCRGHVWWFMWVVL